MSCSDTVSRFKKFKNQITSDGFDTTKFWRLQVAARDAIMDVDVSTGAGMGKSCNEMLQIFQALLGGKSGSITLLSDDEWKITTATGENGKKLVGIKIDPKGESVTAQVIQTKKPFYFSDICDVRQSGTVAPERYSSDRFCSFPVMSLTFEVMAVISIAGMQEAHPLFVSEQNSIEGVLCAIGGKIAKLNKNRQVDNIRGDLAQVREKETLRERLLFMTVHDYKNPLSLVISNLSFLEMSDLTDEAMEMVKLSRFGCERLLDMIKSTLDSYKMESSAFIPSSAKFDLAKLIRQMITEFSIAAGFDELVLSYNGLENINIVSDEGLLRRILSNLIDNAMRHSPIGGKIKLSLHKKDESFIITILDEGEGIPKEDQKNIFDLFEQVKAANGNSGNHKGHGIGLSFCAMAVRALGGKIDVESDGIKGSVFTLTLRDSSQ